MVEKMVVQVLMVWFMFKLMCSWFVDLNYLQKDMFSSFVVGYVYEEEVSIVVLEFIFIEDISKLDIDSIVDMVVDNMDVID